MNEAELEVRRALEARKTAFCAAFDTPAGEVVLRDLARFCRANVSTYTPDPRESALLEGRREAYLRIVQHLHMGLDELLALYRGQSNG